MHKKPYEPWLFNGVNEDVRIRKRECLIRTTVCEDNKYMLSSNNGPHSEITPGFWGPASRFLPVSAKNNS
eukprot:16434789-Heterocapsa_arctica.AAC.1